MIGFWIREKIIGVLLRMVAGRILDKDMSHRKKRNPGGIGDIEKYVDEAGNEKWEIQMDTDKHPTWRRKK